MLSKDITQYLRTQIPLTAAMQIAAVASDGNAITLTAPLPPNRNHTETAFGGSLSTLGIVAGWTLLYVALQDAGVSAKLLIQHSATDFLRPADDDLTVKCEFADASNRTDFLAAVSSRRRAKIELVAKIHSGKTHVATHNGTYVAILY